MNKEHVINSLYDSLFKKSSRSGEWEYEDAIVKQKIDETKLRGFPPDLTDRVELRYYRKLLVQLKQMLDINSFKQMTIAEYGSGTGILSLYMAREGAQVTLIDLLPSCLEYSELVREAMSRSGDFIGTINPIHGDFMNLEVSGKFDLVHSTGIVEHFADENAQKMVNKMAQDAKPGGKVFVAVPNFASPDLIHIWSKHGKGSEKFYSKRKLGGMMRRAGLIDIRTTTSTFFYPSFIPNSFAKRTQQIEDLLGSNLGLGFLVMSSGRKPNDKNTSIS